jgi:hypothetical protein
VPTVESREVSSGRGQFAKPHSGAVARLSAIPQMAARMLVLIS